VKLSDANVYRSGNELCQRNEMRIITLELKPLRAYMSSSVGEKAGTYSSLVLWALAVQWHELTDAAYKPTVVYFKGALMWLDPMPRTFEDATSSIEA
jgi:hypothetical protein